MTRSLRAVGALLVLTVAGVALAAPLAPGGAPPWRNPYLKTPRFEHLRPSKTLSLLPKPFQTYQQVQEHTCGAAAAMMVAVYLKVLPRVSLNSATEDKVATEMGSKPDVGTSPDQLFGWLTQHGMDATIAQPGSLDAVRANLKAGLPTLVEWIDWGGHWAVAIGYDTLDPDTTDDDVIILADPADYGDDRRDGITYFNANRFNAMWFDAQYFPPPRPVMRVMITVQARPPTPVSGSQASSGS